MIPRFLLLSVFTCLVACQHKQAAATPESNSAEQARYHKVGLIALPDLEHASAWEKLIHVDMGVPASKIEVQAGPGFTTVTIRDLKNRADVEGVAQELRAIAEKKPEKFGVTRVEVRLNSAPATINPFTLPTEAAPATPNPSSVLPTLSLPPFRIDGR